MFHICKVQPSHPTGETHFVYFCFPKYESVERADFKQRWPKDGAVGNSTSFLYNQMFNRQKESLFWKGPPIFSSLCSHMLWYFFHYSFSPLFLYCVCVTMFLWTKCLIGMKQTPSTRVSHLFVKLTAVCSWEKEMVHSLAVGVPSIHVRRYLLTFINRPTCCFVRTPIRIR